jgi:hypothetical protein
MGGDMADTAAGDKEEILARTLSELRTAEENLAEHERALRAPKGTYVPATPEEIADVQKASREASPRWKAEQKRRKGLGTIYRQAITYRNYIIHFYRKPVPGFGDWSFSHKDYDGAPDGPDTGCSDHRCGYAETPKEARAEIDAQYVDLELDEDGHYTRDGLTLQAGTHE